MDDDEQQAMMKLIADMQQQEQGQHNSQVTMVINDHIQNTILPDTDDHKDVKITGDIPKNLYGSVKNVEDINNQNIFPVKESELPLPTIIDEISPVLCFVKFLT